MSPHGLSIMVAATVVFLSKSLCRKQGVLATSSYSAAFLTTVPQNRWNLVRKELFVGSFVQRNPFFQQLRSASENLDVDDQGRRIRRRRPQEDSDWDIQNDSRNNNNFDVRVSQTKQSDKNVYDMNNSWDDFDPVSTSTSQFPKKDQTRSNERRTMKTNSFSNRRREPDESRRRSGRTVDFQRSSNTFNRPKSSTFSRRDDDYNSRKPRDRFSDNDSMKVRINMNDLETAGFVHLYGLASVMNALTANKRKFPKLSDDTYNANRNEVSDNSNEDEEVKPEAQMSSCLFVQEKKAGVSTRSNDKYQLEAKLLELAKERSIDVAIVDKGVLNTLTGNRPHQGYVLRCGKYEFEPLSRIPFDESIDGNNFWLVLDEVVDPQNLGALIRSAYFLGRVNVLVCAKNSAPPSGTVSAASAGALEVARIYSTSNLPKTLDQAELDGFRIIGASADGEEHLDIPIYDLHNLPLDANESRKQKPTILVLGSEGRGLRHLVAKACTEFVRIPSLNNNINDNVAVDSLNVSVTGGILLWHILSRML